MTEQQNNPRNYFLTLDSFRGICACIVAFSHFHANSFFNRSPILDRGDIYVDFFFVLSGFVIFANYGEKLQQGYSVGKFVWLRFWRLYPLHFAVLMAFIIPDLLQMVVHVDGAAAYAPFSAQNEGLNAIFANLFLVHALHILPEGLSFNGPSWSISVEFYTYIIMAFILTLFRKSYRILLSVLAISSAIALFYLKGELYAKTDFGILRCIYGFSCGIAAYLIYNYISSKFSSVKSCTWTMLEIVAITSIAIYIGLWSFGLGSMLAPLLFSALVVLFAFEGGKISQILKSKVFLLLGTLSYSIYMTHIFIAGKFFALPARLLENKLHYNLFTNIDGVKHFGTNIYYGTMIEIFYLLVVIFCSYISYKIIESPFRNWSKRALKKFEEKNKELKPI